MLHLLPGLCSLTAALLIPLAMDHCRFYLHCYFLYPESLELLPQFEDFFIIILISVKNGTRLLMEISLNLWIAF